VDKTNNLNMMMMVHSLRSIVDVVNMSLRMSACSGFNGDLLLEGVGAVGFGVVVIGVTVMAVVSCDGYRVNWSMVVAIWFIVTVTVVSTVTVAIVSTVTVSITTPGSGIDFLIDVFFAAFSTLFVIFTFITFAARNLR
jgi:hypothetical protein